MAVFTHISEDALRAHLAGYGIGELVSFAGIGEGTQNTNYRLATQTGGYILTLFEDAGAGEGLPFCLDLMAHLHAKGVPTPGVVANRAGERIVPLAGRLSAITTFLAGQSPGAITPAHCAALGGTVARMHRAVSDFPLSRENPLGPAAWRAHVEEGAGRMGRFAPDLEDLLRAELEALDRAVPPGLPRGAVHADIFPDNVFFENGAVSGVFDFFLAGTDAFAYDLMMTLNAWCFDSGGGFVQARAAALLGAYAQERPLSRAEREALPALGRAAAVAIASARVSDSLNADPGALITLRDPVEYARILRFHQGVASPAAYGIAA